MVQFDATGATDPAGTHPWRAVLQTIVQDLVRRPESRSSVGRQASALTALETALERSRVTLGGQMTAGLIILNSDVVSSRYSEACQVPRKF